MPARPEVSPATEELYESLAPAFTDDDEDREWATLNLCAALVSADLDLIFELVTEEEAPGWQIILDPVRCPRALLPYLAGFVGVVLLPNMTEEQERAAILQPECFERGTIDAIEAVAKRGLTGTQAVIVTERYTGSAWRLRLETIEAETPDPARLKQEIIDQQKPIGIALFFNERTPWTWEELLAESAEYPTWKAVGEAFPTWFDLRVHEP